jgi:probable F420-dependent oxidoreductase
VHLGVSFPHAEVGSDPTIIRDFVQSAENAGFDYLSAFEHVAGARADRLAGVSDGSSVPPNLFDDPFHEPFTLFAYLAGLTSRIEFATSVLVLPQRQTVLVAKQAAEVSLLSGGRLRLGVGVGWNPAEYEALGSDFHTRGRRVTEQVVVLRKLWTEPLVTFEGEWHTLDRVGIAPLPIHPIPIWMGGGIQETTLRRIARVADGWMPMGTSDVDSALVARMRRYLDEAGRTASSLGIQGGIRASAERADWLRAARRWSELGATHLGITVSLDSELTAFQRLEKAIEVKRILAAELGY